MRQKIFLPWLPGSDYRVQFRLSPKFVESYDRTEFIKQRAIELSVAAKLMEHMCEQGADDEEYTALVLYTYLVIDSVKYAINFTKAGEDLGIPELMDKYMHKGIIE